MASKTTKSSKKTTRTTAAKSIAKRPPVKKTSSTRKSTKTSTQIDDFRPNLVAFLTAVAAVVIIFSFALISVLPLKY